MKHEGMVHALEEIHRLLRPDGSLIDIHPVLEAPLIEAYQGANVLFAEPSPDYSGEDYRQAEHALAQIVQRRLFVIDRKGEFDFLTYGSSVAELRDFLAKANAYDQRPKDEAVAAREAELYTRVEESMQTAGEGAEVAYHERARIARLKPMR
ncbi:MAG: hypothetical protein HYY39_07510 [Armatimonadetes bacterium]|nr:hypothetical protein [Armatimonadota bacterium]